MHGGVDARELARLGIEPASVHDLSVNVNPFGPHPAVAAAVARASLAEYPDRTASTARAALASALDCEPDRIALGHGSVELLWALVSGLRREANGRPLLIVGPTFGEPEAAARANDVATVHVDMLEADGFAIDVARIEAAIVEHAPAAVYLCQPNNPTGRALGSRELQGLLERQGGTTFILDQAFLSLSSVHGQQSLRMERLPHVVAVRSLTKDHALAGLRVGYALATPERIRTLDAQRPPWMVSTLAQAAVIAAVQHPEHVAHARAWLLDARQQLSAAIARLGPTVVPSETHFCLVRVGDADLVRERILRSHRLLVRSGRSFGLPQYIRVAAGAEETRVRLVDALAEHAR